MASQFVTFLLIFALGLAMVIVVNDIFSGLTDQMRDSVSKPEINDIITGLRTTVIDSYLLIKNGEEGSITLALDKLPSRLSDRYRYEIRSFVSGNVYYLNLTVDKITARDTTMVSTGLTVDEVDLSINLKSEVTAHYLTTTKTSTGITITLDDS